MHQTAWHALQLLARSAGMALASLLIFGAMPGAMAQGGGGQSSTEDTRHFEGERFISLTNIRVYAKPSTEAHIVRDIPTLRMVYAKPTRDPAWLQVFGAGVQRHPYRRQGIQDPVDVKNGKLVLELKRTDRNVYRGFSGYVEAAGLGSLDRPLPLPDSFTAQAVPIPGPLESIGVPESRFAPGKPLHSPFRSVVDINIGTAGCTGFVVEKSGLVATSGHCFADGKADLPISVMLPVPENGYRNPVAVPARLVYWQYQRYTNGAWLDSALLEVTDSRFQDIPPLHLLRPGTWLHAGALQVAAIGFGLDLALVKAHWAKSNSVPHVSVCSLSAGQMQANQGVLNVRSSNMECPIGHGDSGGPLLLWNSTSSRFEVLGLASWIWNLDLNSDEVLTHEARAIVGKALNDQSEKYGQELPLPALQGLSSLRKFLEKSTSTYQRPGGWNLDERLYQEVAARTGNPSAFGAVWDQFAEASPLSRLPDNTYIVDHAWRLATFRKARRTLAAPLPSAKWKQARATYGDRLEIAQLKTQGYRVTSMFLGEILEVGKPLVLFAEYDDYLRKLEPEVEAMLKAKPHLKNSLPRIHLDYGVVEVGPDLYVVTQDGLIVTEVIRNWMQDVDADGNKRTPKAKPN